MRAGCREPVATILRLCGALALTAMLVPGVSRAAPPPAARQARVVERRPPRAFELVDAGRRGSDERVAWAMSLPPILVKNQNTGARATIRLYGADGEVDRIALRTFMRVAASSEAAAEGPTSAVTEPLDARLVQLVIRAAYHFRGAPVVIVSAVRSGSEGKHGTGDALDFRLQGVRASSVAAHLRRSPRVGVGLYTHPKTQFVHLDVRDRSFHWIDGSPPKVKWRERRLRDPGQKKRDASYEPVMDLPEVATAPAPDTRTSAARRRVRSHGGERRRGR